MPRVIGAAMVEPVSRILLGAIDAGDGGTAEQRSVLGAVVAGYWERPDLDLTSLSTIGPEAVPTVGLDAAERRRVREFMVLLELCRHPLTDQQVTLVDTYAQQLGESGPGLEVARGLVREGTARALADLQRFKTKARPNWSEPSLVDRSSTVLAEPDLELTARLRALHDLPEGTLGWEYVEFYRRYGLALPGEDPNMAAFFVGHDMNHVIAGYGTTGQGETALSAMLLGMDDSDDHWVLFLTSLSAYELGLSSSTDFEGKVGVLAREGAADMLAEALRRGSQCTGDFSVIDHLEIAHLPLDEVRARFGVPPLVGANS
jgi:hypothetical protein